MRIDDVGGDAARDLRVKAAAVPAAPIGTLLRRERRTRVILAFVGGAAVAAAVLVPWVVLGGSGNGELQPVGTTVATVDVTPTSGPVPVDVAPPSTAVPPPISAPPPTAASGLAGEVPVPLRLMVQGRLLELSTVPGVEVGRFPATSFTGNPPVESRFGVVAAVGELYDAPLWLVTPSGEALRLADSVGSAALAGDLETVVYAQHVGGVVGTAGSSTRLVTIRLPSGEVIDELTVEGFADVKGWAGTVVLLTTGDGGRASAATWVPGSDSVTSVAGYGTAAAGDPVGSAAVFYKDDGTCPVLVVVDADGSVSTATGDGTTGSLSCGPGRAPAFSPNGALLALAGTVEGGPGGSPVLTVVSTSDNTVRYRITIEDVIERFFSPQQTIWLDEDTLVVYAETWTERSAEDPHAGTRALYRCELSQQRCVAVRTIPVDPQDYREVAVVWPMATTTRTNPRCASTPPRETTATGVYVFFECGDLFGPLYPATRTVSPGVDPLTAAVQHLVNGTTSEERSLGLSGAFGSVDPEEAALIHVEASVDSSGVAHVDFRIGGERWSPGQLAGTSHQLISLLDPLLATVFQFDGVAALDMSLLCWGDSGCRGVTTRAVWEDMEMLNRRLPLDQGCTLIDVWTDPACHPTP